MRTRNSRRAAPGPPCCPARCDATRLPHKTMTAGTETTIRVAIVEDRREIREGLATIINGTPGFRCSGSYRSMEDALERIGGNVPDVVLNDIGLPGMNGIDGIRILKERHPALLILMLTIYD